MRFIPVALADPLPWEAPLGADEDFPLPVDTSDALSLFADVFPTNYRDYPESDDIAILAYDNFAVPIHQSTLDRMLDRFTIYGENGMVFGFISESALLLALTLLNAALTVLAMVSLYVEEEDEVREGPLKAVWLA